MQFEIAMPKSWDEGTINAVLLWTAASGSGDIKWLLAGRTYGDSDALDDTISFSNSSTDTLLTANDLHISPSTNPDISGTAVEGDIVILVVSRDAAAGADTLDADAKLIGVRLTFTTNAANDD